MNLSVRTSLAGHECSSLFQNGSPATGWQASVSMAFALARTIRDAQSAKMARRTSTFVHQSS